MTSLMQTYSAPVDIANIQAFLTHRGIAHKIDIVCNHNQWYIFNSNYFTDNQLHVILDDLCDYVLEAAQ
jgi:hypothetical protein